MASRPTPLSPNSRRPPIFKDPAALTVRSRFKALPEHFRRTTAFVVSSRWRSIPTGVVRQPQDGTARRRSGEPPAQRIADWVSHDLMGFVKFFDASLPEDHPENVYMERERRSVRSIQFSESDIRRVYVASGYEARLRADLPALGGRVVGL